MKAVALSAAAIALVGVAVGAQEAGQESPASKNDTQLAGLVELSADGTGADQPRWIDSIGQSSLLTQLTAVLRAREATMLAEARLAQNTVQITPGMSDQIVAREENCRRMPGPGSRIQTERCFTETESEKRLNQYQFDEELRFSRQEALRRQLEDMRNATEAARRAAGIR